MREEFYDEYERANGLHSSKNPVNLDGDLDDPERFTAYM